MSAHTTRRRHPLLVTLGTGWVTHRARIVHDGPVPEAHTACGRYSTTWTEKRADDDAAPDCRSCRRAA